MVKCSFIVPAYNVEKYLERCIRSIMDQSCSDYEIIIIDDGSTDKTGMIADEICETYNSSYFSIRVIHQENKGLGGARNTGILTAKGDYIVFVDSDDFVRQDMIEIAFKYIERYSLDIFVFGFLETADEHRNINITDEENFKIIDTKNYLISCGVTAWNKIYKKSIFTDNNLFYPEKQIYEDVAITPLTAIYSKQIGVVDSKLYFYYQRPGSIINTNQGNRIYELHKGLDFVFYQYQREKCYEAYHDQLEFIALVHALYFTSVRIYTTKYNYETIIDLERYVADRFPNYRGNKYISDRQYVYNNGVDNEELFKYIVNGKYRYVYYRYFCCRKFKQIIKSIIRGVK